jgi:predicted transcriptional regulator
VFIALFVWMGAASEASAALTRSVLGGIPVSRAMITHFETLAPVETLQRALAHVLEGFQQDFPVVEAGRVVGVLTRANMMKGLMQTGADTPVAEAMTSEFDSAEPAEMLEGAVQRLQASGCPALPVVQDGKLVGVLTMENVGEFMMVHSALRANRARATQAT